MGRDVTYRGAGAALATACTVMRAPTHVPNGWHGCRTAVAVIMAVHLQAPRACRAPDDARSSSCAQRTISVPRRGPPRHAAFARQVRKTRLQSNSCNRNASAGAHTGTNSRGKPWQPSESIITNLNSLTGTADRRLLPARWPPAARRRGARPLCRSGTLPRPPPHWHNRPRGQHSNAPF